MTPFFSSLAQAARNTPEGKPFLAGCVLFVMAALLFSLVGFIGQDPAQFWSLAVLRISLGRSGGLYAGFMMGLGFAWVFAICAVVEIIWVFLISPLALLGMKHTLGIPFVRRYVDRKEKTVELWSARLRKGGFMALFLFVVAPLPMSGPITGSLVAQFMGYSVRKNFFLVTLASFFSALFWSVIIFNFHAWLAQYGEIVQWAAFFGMIVLGLAAYVVQRVRMRNA